MGIDELLDNPVDVVNDLFKQRKVFGRLHCLCPPASSHDGKENTVRTTSRETFPPSNTLIALGERPRPGTSPFRLARGPPADPIISVLADVTNDGQRLLRVLPAFQPISYLRWPRA